MPRTKGATSLSSGVLKARFAPVLEGFRDGVIDLTAAVASSVTLTEVGRAFDLVRTASAGGRVLVVPRLL